LFLKPVKAENDEGIEFYKKLKLRFFKIFIFTQKKKKNKRKPITYVKSLVYLWTFKKYLHMPTLQVQQVSVYSLTLQKTLMFLH
jgi:hypothetical protein